MYARLAVGNAKRSIKEYLIYFITLTLCVSLFYAFLSLSSSSYELITEDNSLNFELLKNILKYATYVITAILAILIAYVNKYMIRRRQKEFATYILLGTEQKSVALMFFIETLIIGVISIIVGILVGTILSQVITALVLMTAKQEIVFSFKLYMDTIGITFIFFILIFCITGLYNVRVLKKSKLIEMINAEKKTEFQFKRSKIVYKIIFAMAMIIYSVCGYFSYKIIEASKDPTILVNEKIYPVIILLSFIAGTYALFYSLAYIIILIKDRWISFKYEYTNLFLIGTIVSKIKTAPILMATISITFLGAALSFTLTLIMAQWSLGYLDYRVPFDITIGNNYSQISKISDLPKINYNEIIEELKKKDYDLKEYCELERYLINPNDFSIRKGAERPILAMSLGDYNKLRQMLGYSKVTLNNNEFTMQWDNGVEKSQVDKYIKDKPSIDVNSQKLNISSTPYYMESMGEWIYGSNDVIIILQDELCEKLTRVSTDFFANTNKKISNDKGGYLEYEYVPKWFEKNNKNLLKDDKKASAFIQTRIRSLEANEILNASLGTRILGIYLGAVLLMISLTILSLQQLSDSIEHKLRFKTLKRLGIDIKEINKIILKQISLYFIMPVLICIIGFTIFMYNFANIYSKELNIYIGDRAVLFNIGISLVLILVIYGCYFIATYYMFKNNIKDDIKSQ